MLLVTRLDLSLQDPMQRGKTGLHVRSNLVACALVGCLMLPNCGIGNSCALIQLMFALGFRSMLYTTTPSNTEGAISMQTLGTWSCSKAYRRARDRSMSLRVW
jgi:hypothetical protein